MPLSPQLWIWQFRHVMPATFGLAFAAAFVLSMSGNLLIWNRNHGWLLFVLMHCAIITLQLGRPNSGSFAFLYTRGFSRNQLWLHTMLAAATSVLIVWGTAALMIWTGVRSAFQDGMRNPEFPIMAPLEYDAPWAWLGVYFVIFAAMQYDWIRRAQPAHGRATGPLLLAAMLGAVIYLVVEQYSRSFWLEGAMILMIAACILLAISARAHSNLEVRR